MKVKVQCSCETKYAFDVEPVNGRMPVRVTCPGCGADGTDAANAIIRQQFAESDPPAPVPVPVALPAEPKPRIRIGGDAPLLAPAPFPAASAATAVSAPPPAPAEAPVVQFCAKHRQQPVTDACLVCGKPICAKCMEQFGYLCSVYCQSQAEQRGIEVPFYEGQKFAVKAKEWRKTKLALA